ncbi:MAG: DUF2147 domain-containing protein [Sphingomonas sp.]|nr:DUF2147 domain-containing protein [Sphingomonas sp.]
MRSIAAVTLLLMPATAHAAEPITGQWLTKEGKAIVTVAPCGQGVCGRITKVIKPNPEGHGVDERNPNPALRNRPIVGLPILSNFADNGRDWRGRIYDPEAGKEYRSILKKLPDGTLQVQGCIAFLCQTQLWRPVR